MKSPESAVNGRGVATTVERKEACQLLSNNAQSVGIFVAVVAKWSDCHQRMFTTNHRKLLLRGVLYFPKVHPLRDCHGRKLRQEILSKRLQLRLWWSKCANFGDAAGRIILTQ